MYHDVILTVPNLQGQGGVSTYYNSVLPFLEKSNFNIFPLEIGSWGKERSIFQPLQDQLRYMNASIKKRNTAFVHINPSLGGKSFWRDGLFAWLAKMNGQPLLVFFHGWDHEFAEKVEAQYLTFFQKTIGRADGIIVLASEFKEKLIKWGVQAPIFIETTAVDESLTYGLHSAFSQFDSSMTRLLFLSRLEKGKGIMETIEAVELLNRRGYNLVLTIAGDGSARSEAQRIVEQKGMDDYCYFLGHINGQQKAECFASHDIYCLPSHGEGLPITVLEAMAFGMPVLTTSVGGLKDVFLDGVMGYLLPNTLAENIAEKVELLIKQPKKLDQIAQFNFNYAHENFMAGKVSNRLLDIYKCIQTGLR